MPQYNASVEPLTSSLDSPALMGGIIALDGGKCRDRLFECIESEQPPSRRNDLRETGVLNDARPRGGQIADSAATEPSRSGGGIKVFGHTELSARPLDVVAIIIGGCRNDVGVDYVPAQLAPAPNG